MWDEAAHLEPTEEENPEKYFKCHLCSENKYKAFLYQVMLLVYREVYS